jgi:SAM-dependent methyltransferase
MSTDTVRRDHVVHRTRCRFCGAPLRYTFIDLGMQPLCNGLLTSDRLNNMEPFYPLHAQVCEECFLVQLQTDVSPGELFEDYSYFSSYSDAWLEHARKYVDMIVERLNLSARHQVVEVASNDGYLLQHFVRRGIPAYGIDPAANVAEAAIRKGVPTELAFFGLVKAKELCERGCQADLIIGNNVLAHVPDLNDFVAGLKALLRPRGVVTMEFPHLLRLMEENQFDTIYHEHFSYFSLAVIEKIFPAHGLRLVDVEEIATHGGSLRIYACHADEGEPAIGVAVDELKRREQELGFTSMDAYLKLGERVRKTKQELFEFLLRVRRGGNSVVGYGAPGKGNTLLNYCGIRTDLVDYTVDRNPHKQGRYLPGSRIPVFSPDKISETKPAYVLILPWNLKNEIMQQIAYIREWGGQFVVPIPEVRVYA